MFRRAIHALASRPARPLPDLPPAATPSSLLALAKRGLEARHAKLFPTVQDLFSKTVADLRDAGVPVTDRRLIALLVEKLRQGHHPSTLSCKLPPKRKVRGHGDRVQNGIRKQ